MSRQIITDISNSKSIISSIIIGILLNCEATFSISSFWLIIFWPFPSYPNRLVLITTGSPSCFIPSMIFSYDDATTNLTVLIPILLRNFFSFILSWHISKDLELGYTFLISWHTLIVSNGIFSNSYVITSTFFAKFFRLFISSYLKVLDKLVTCLAGALKSGSYICVLNPNWEADKESILPSWPPPKIPITLPNGNPLCLFIFWNHWNVWDFLFMPDF